MQGVPPDRLIYVIAVGPAIAGRPPHRSVRAELPHTALTSNTDDQSRTLVRFVRTPYNPRDLMTRLCVRFRGDCLAFFSVSPLSSTDSAAVGCPALFACFSGTTGLSDFPETYMSAVWHLAFSDRSTSLDGDVSGISQLPRGSFPAVRVVSDSVGVTSDSPLSFDVTVAFPLSRQGRPPQTVDLGAQYTARPFPCERFDLLVARQNASLGAKLTG